MRGGAIACPRRAFAQAVRRRASARRATAWALAAATFIAVAALTVAPAFAQMSARAAPEARP